MIYAWSHLFSELTWWENEHGKISALLNDELGKDRNRHGRPGVESIWHVAFPQVKFPTSELLVSIIYLGSGLVSAKISTPVIESHDYQ